LKNVNVSWEKTDFVITNNIITCGVNYENKDFDYNYLYIASHNTPRDIIQVSYRLRHLNTGIIKICYMGRMNQQNTWLNDCSKINCPVYSGLYRDILVEKKAPIKRAFQFFCKKAHYKQTIDEFDINEALEKELKDLLEKGNAGMSYDNIRTINYLEMEQIQKLCIEQVATMEHKFQMSKYFYRKMVVYLEDAEDRIILNEKLAEIWDEKYDIFFKRMCSVFSNKNNIFNKIAEENNFRTLFPNDVKKVTLTPDLKDLIFKQFSFKNVKPMSANCKIVKEIYNLYFGKFMIKIECENKKPKYTIDELVHEYHDFGKKYLVIDRETKSTMNNYEKLKDEINTNPIIEI